MKQLFYGADILRLSGDTWELLKEACIAIDGDTISYIGTDRPQDTFDVKKAYHGHLLLPGLYNTHTHTPMTLLRGLGSDLPLDRWLHEGIFPTEARMTAEDIRAGTKLALMELLKSGVVSFTDMYDFPAVTAEEVASSGMKASLNRPVLAFDEEEPYDLNFRAQESIAFFNEYHGMANGNVQVDFAVHAEYTSKPHVVEQYALACKEHGARMHVHLSETKKEHEECKVRHGKTPARYFYDLGLFRSPTTAAHCVAIEEEDIQLLREMGVTAVHNPTSNMKLASGFMPLPALLKAGVNVALGTDGAASNNNLNMFEEMHLAAILHKGYTGDPTAVSPGDVLKMATINGARAQGRDNAGLLSVGKRADIIAVDLSAPHLTPVLDAPSLVVYAMQASDVRMTMVNGRVLYENGVFPTIDTEKARADFEKALQRIFG